MTDERQDHVEESVGQARTILVFGTGEPSKAVLSVVSSQATAISPRMRKSRFAFVGPVRVDSQTRGHLQKVVLPLVDQVLAALGRKPLQFQLSVANLGAASASDLGLEISGFSLDVAVCLSMLSAALELPMRQDVVATGHVASLDGTVLPVKDLPAKLDAATRDPSVREIICPILDADGSLGTLAPEERRKIERAMVDARASHVVTAVGDVCDALVRSVTDRGLLLSSLSQDFFEPAQAAPQSNSLAARLVGFLTADNEHRFWTELEDNMFGGRADAARELLAARVRHQVRRRSYPASFGRRLLQLLRSMPRAIRRLKLSTPILDMATCRELLKLATEADDADCQSLFESVSGKVEAPHPPRAEVAAGPAEDPNRGDIATLEVVLDEISEETLTREVLAPIDQARGSFSLDSSTVTSSEEFYEIITAFYIHLLRHTDAMPPSISQKAAQEDVLELLNSAFAREAVSPNDERGPVKAALAVASSGTGGGMRYVLDALTDRFKTKHRDNHVTRVLEYAVDHMHEDDCVRFVTLLLKRLEPHLPPEVRNQPPERYARHYGELARAYGASLDRMRALLRAL